MKRLLKRFLVVLLLGWLPLQASAFPLIALLCERNPSDVHGYAAVHVQHGHAGDASGHESHGNAGDDPASLVSLHNCCHNLTSAAVPTITKIPAAPATGIDPTPLLHFSSFVPDQPKRPPLAA